MSGTEVFYCTRCVISNQRPRITFDERGVCSACQNAERKKLIDWNQREVELLRLLDRYRSRDGSYDVIVPASGGKDSSSIAHKLKHNFGMHPLTVTWSPNVYTDIGWQNHRALVESGFDNILGQPDGQVNRRFVRVATEIFGDPFLPFIYGVKAFPLRMALAHDVKLIMYAEDGEVEYGGDTKNAERGTIDIEQDMVRQYFSGYPVESWTQHGLTMSELKAYAMPAIKDIVAAGIDYRYFAHYQKWVPQENFYYSCEHTGFKCNPVRNEGTYSKYASLDDRLDGFHYYLMFIKFGIGRATSDAAHEIRDGHLTREEGVNLVRKYDGEFPARHYQAFLDYLGKDDAWFQGVVDNLRKPHIWEKIGGQWRLKHQVS